MSARTASARPPHSSIRLTVPLAAFSPPQKLTPTGQPSPPSALAIADPIPPEAPVTSAQPSRPFAVLKRHPT
jgi:hypothetical protein